MVEAATFLAASVSFLIGSRNGETAGRHDSSTLLRIVLFRYAPFCLKMLEHPASPLFLIRSHSRRLSCSFSIYSSRLIVRSFVHLSVHLSVYLSVFVDRHIRSYIRSSRCALSYYFSPAIFALLVSTSYRFSLVRVGIRFDTNPDSWVSEESAPLHYYVLTRE